MASKFSDPIINNLLDIFQMGNAFDVDTKQGALVRRVNVERSDVYLHSFTAYADQVTLTFKLTADKLAEDE